MNYLVEMKLANSSRPVMISSTSCAGSALTISASATAPFIGPPARIFFSASSFLQADFVFAFYQGRHVQLQPGALGASYCIVTTVVPILLVTHMLIFRLLVGSKPGRESEQNGRLEQIEVRIPARSDS